MDFNVYWLLKKEDSLNLRYCLENSSPKKFHVRNINGLRPTIVDESVEGKTLTFKKKKNSLLFLIDQKECYNLKTHEKSFSLRYTLNEKLKEDTELTNADYENGDYLEITFNGKIEVEPSEFERAPGIPFYRIKKS